MKLSTFRRKAKTKRAEQFNKDRTTRTIFCRTSEFIQYGNLQKFLMFYFIINTSIQISMIVSFLGSVYVNDHGIYFFFTECSKFQLHLKFSSMYCYYSCVYAWDANQCILLYNFFFTLSLILNIFFFLFILLIITFFFYFDSEFILLTKVKDINLKK